MQFVLRVSVQLLMLFVIGVQIFDHNLYAAQQQKPKTERSEQLSVTLSECLVIALENNRNRPISQAAVAIAEAQYKQAQSAYWPRMNINILAHRMDEDPNYVFPAETSTYTIQGLAPVPTTVQVDIPEKDIKLMDRDSIFSSLDIALPLYMGGKRHAVSKQARIGLQAAKVSARRTDLEVTYDVKRMYHGAVLAKKLQTLGRQTLDRFKVTLDLTRQLYQTGSGSVKKTDYLRTKVIVSTLQAMLEELSSNEVLARAALVNTLGLDWDNDLVPAATEIPFNPFKGDLKNLITDAYQFNPDWERLELALEAAEAGIKKARSGHFPVIALMGSLNHIDNSYDKGHVTDENIDSWSLGLNLNLPIFSGFQTVHAVREAKMRLEKLKHERLLFREGLALMVKSSLLQVDRARGQVESTREAVEAALENRELNVRAYQNELAETREVIEAQLMESFIKGKHIKALYDHATSQAKMNFLIGNQIQKVFN